VSGPISISTPQPQAGSLVPRIIVSVADLFFSTKSLYLASSYVAVPFAPLGQQDLCNVSITAWLFAAHILFLGTTARRLFDRLWGGRWCHSTRLATLLDIARLWDLFDLT
jgi:hypothetical protein